MAVMRLDELPTSDRIEDRRGLTTSRAGIGVGTVVVLGLIGWALGIDPRLLIGGAEVMSRSGQTQQQTEVGTGTPSDEMGHFVSAILGSTEAEWKEVFDQAGKTYKPPTLVMFTGGVEQTDANALQVRVELQADCLAGVWANRAHAKWQFIEPGDVEAALQTASAIGDDRLRRQSQGYVPKTLAMLSWLTPRLLNA